MRWLEPITDKMLAACEHRTFFLTRKQADDLLRRGFVRYNQAAYAYEWIMEPLEALPDVPADTKSVR